ncbi:MAG: hypothetical protein SOU51_02580 [Collinsella sp.]|nr:hypothetical protein [Collinsella sp.]
MLLAAMALIALAAIAALFNPFVGGFALFQLIVLFVLPIVHINIRVRERAIAPRGATGMHRKMVDYGGMSLVDAKRFSARVIVAMTWLLRVLAILLVAFSVAIDGALILLCNHSDLGGPKSVSPVVGVEAAPLALVLFVISAVLSIVAAALILRHAGRTDRAIRLWLEESREG